MKDKEKGKREDWYLPWVIRPELIRAHQEWQRSSTPLPGSSSSSLYKLPGSSSSSSLFNGGAHKSLPLSTTSLPLSSSSSSSPQNTCSGSPTLTRQPPGSPKKRPVGPSVSREYPLETFTFSLMHSFYLHEWRKSMCKLGRCFIFLFRVTRSYSPSNNMYCL